MLFTAINDIASFNLFSLDFISDWIFKFDEQSEVAHSDSFSFMGYESLNLIRNLSMLFYMTLVQLLLFLLRLTCQMLSLKKSNK